MQNLIGGIYDAAAEPALWNEVLAHLVRKTGASNGIFYHHDTVARETHVLGAEGFDPFYVRQYERYYGALDPWHRYGQTRPVGEIRQTAAMLPDSELRRTEFYQDHLRPQGLFYAMGAPVERTRSSMAVFGIQGSYENGVFAPEAEKLLQRVAPHLRRAFNLQRRLDSVRAEGLAFESALHLLAQPVLVVDRDGHLFSANAAGEQLLRRGNVLRLSSGRLVAAHRDDRRALAKAFNPVPTGDADATLTLRGNGGDVVTLRVAPLRRPNRAEWSGRIALFVEVPPPRRRFDLLASAFRLSPAEARLWAGLVAGERLVEIAERSKISPNTARVQLRSLFEKTGTHRQADLVRLALERGMDPAG